MKQVLASLILCCFLFHAAEAKIWRVNNNTGVAADFNSLTTAVASASVHAGDTIHVEASSAAYSGIQINKKLIIIGTGYFLTDATPNPKTEANTNVANVGSIEFQPGSAGSVAEGLTLGGAFIEDGLITLQRNYINSYVYLGYTGTITCNADTIRQNYVYGIVSNNTNATITNLMFYNNILYGTGFDFNSNLNKTSGFAINNDFLGNSFVCINITFQDNIFNSPSFGSYMSSNAFFNNMASNTGITSGNSNQLSVNLNNVYQGYSSGTGFSSDGRYMLKPGSPAINAGVINGVTVDCGAFGGPAPYVLSGMPPVPSIYALSVPSSVASGTTTMNVTISSTTAH